MLEEERIRFLEPSLAAALQEVQHQILLATTVENPNKDCLGVLLSQLEELKEVVTKSYAQVFHSKKREGIMAKMSRLFSFEEHSFPSYSLEKVLNIIQEAIDSINLRTETGFNKKRLQIAETELNRFASEVRLAESEKK